MPTSVVVNAVQLADWAAAGALVLALAVAAVVLGQTRVIRRNSARTERLRYELGRCPREVMGNFGPLGRCTRQIHAEGSCTLNAPRPDLHSDDVWNGR